MPNGVMKVRQWALIPTHIVTDASLHQSMISGYSGLSSDIGHVPT